MIRISRTRLFREMSKDFFPGVCISPEEISQLVAVATPTVLASPCPVSIENLRRLLQLEAIFKKRTDGEIPREILEEEALNSLMDNEADMELLNTERPWRRHAWFNEAVFLVHQVLRPLELSWEDVGTRCKFGPGATHSGSGPQGRHLLSKIGGTQTTTRTGIRVVGQIVREFFPHWYDEVLSSCPTMIVPGNRIAFVPKDWKRLRQIAVEPSLNMFVQQGIGSVMLNRLRLFGVNLTDQSRNRRLAQKGSHDGTLATIDLKDASSRICYALVKDLLPRDWMALLDAVRSPWGLLPDGSHMRYHSFSTQGNGYTFPLESLVFWAVLKAALPRRAVLSVYGDDIIVETKHYRRALTALAAIGAIVNETKSFAEGPFRESCGGDYISGVPVRPVFYKEPAAAPSDVACLHNLLVERNGWDLIQHTRAYLVSVVPVSHRAFGPPGVVSDVDAETPLLRNRVALHYRSWFWCEEPLTKGFTRNLEPYMEVRAYSIRPRRLRFSSTSMAKYLCFLYGGSRAVMSSSLYTHSSRLRRLPVPTCVFPVFPGGLLSPPRP